MCDIICERKTPSRSDRPSTCGTYTGWWWAWWAVMLAVLPQYDSCPWVYIQLWSCLVLPFLEVLRLVSVHLGFILGFIFSHAYYGLYCGWHANKWPYKLYSVYGLDAAVLSVLHYKFDFWNALRSSLIFQNYKYHSLSEVRQANWYVLDRYWQIARQVLSRESDSLSMQLFNSFTQVLTSCITEYKHSLLVSITSPVAADRKV